MTIIEATYNVYNEYYMYTIQLTYFTINGSLHEEKEARFLKSFSVRERH